MATQTIDISTSGGAGLMPDRSPEARRLSLALTTYLQHIQKVSGTAKILHDGQTDCRVFLQPLTGAPDAATEDPGGDCVFIYNTADDDLYFVSGWTAADSGTFTKILD